MGNGGNERRKKKGRKAGRRRVLGGSYAEFLYGSERTLGGDIR